MGQNRPWPLEVGSSAVANVPEESCIWCTNGIKEVTYDKLVITQKGSCKSALDTKDISALKFPVMTYQSKPLIQKLGQASQFFSNKNPILCPISKCGIVPVQTKTQVK